MKTTSALALAVAVLAATPAVALGQPSVEGWSIARPGTFHGDEVSRRPGRGWMALRVEGGLWHLVPASVTATTAFDPVLDPDGGPFTGIALASVPEAFLLLRGPLLVAGKVDAADMRFSGSVRALAPDSASTPHEVAVPFRGETFRLDYRATAEKASALDRSSSMQLVLREPAGTVRVLHDGPLGGNAALLFAGDVDRDGRPDFVLDLSDHDNVADLCLLLSSRGYAKASCLRTVGC